MNVRDLFEYHIDKELREDPHNFGKSRVMEAFDKAQQLVKNNGVLQNVSKSFTPLIGDIVEILYSEDNFNVGDKVEVYESHEEDGFWVVGNDDPNTYNESIHISNLKEIN